MAEVIVVDGPAKISINDGGSLAVLGYTEAGVVIVENVFTADVPGDENGGPEGPPIDIQYFGEMHTVRLEMSKWDPAVETRIAAKFAGETQGSPGTPGALYSAEGGVFRLLIEPTQNPRNYIAAIPRQPSEINKGTKYSRRVFVFDCYSTGGVLFNSTIV